MSRNLCKLVIFIVLVLCAGSRCEAQTVFPEVDWQEATPESRGVDSAKLQEAMDYFGAHADRPGDHGLGVKRAVVVRDGYVIWKGSDLTTQTPIYSATKSFTSTVLGLLIQDGKCTLDTRVAQHLPAMKEHYEDVRLRHFATMTSGYDGAGGSRCGKSADDAFDGSDTFYKPARPIFAPGTKYLYWDDSMRQFINTLSRIAGEKVENLFKRRIADPIGMKNWDWQKQYEVDGMEINGQIQITAPDLARFGLLFLNRGKWKDKQLINSEWIDQATRVQVPASMPLHQAPCEKADGRGLYGFNWWINGKMPDGKLSMPSAPPKTFMASGHYHNICIVVPEWNMVIVRLGTTERPSNKYEIWDTFLSKIKKAVGSKKAA